MITTLLAEGVDTMNPSGVDTAIELGAMLLIILGSWVGIFIKDYIDRRRDRAAHRENVFAITSEVKKNHDLFVSEISEVKDKISQVQGQVVNGHSDAPPMRADIDSVLIGVNLLAEKVEGLSDLVRNHGKDISGVRDDVGQLREEVRDVRHDHGTLERRILTWAKRERPHGEPF
jgi:hypothetical protein